jgi:hypothetical protein
VRSSIEGNPPQRWCWLVWGLNLAYSIPDSTAQRSTAFLLILGRRGNCVVKEKCLCGKHSRSWHLQYCVTNQLPLCVVSLGSTYLTLWLCLQLCSPLQIILVPPNRTHRGYIVALHVLNISICSLRNDASQNVLITWSLPSEDAMQNVVTRISASDMAVA